MQPWPQPQVILTHESDLDGLLAGLLLQKVAKHWFNINVPLQAYQNDAWQKRVFTENSAWVGDFSFEPRLDKINWVVVDHHARLYTPSKALLLHDANECTTSLVYQVCREIGLNNANLDRLVRLCRIADLFLQDDPEFALANDYANLVKTYQFRNLCELVQSEPERLLDHALLEVMAVKRKVEDPLGLEFARNHITALSPAVAYVDTFLGNSNLIINQLLKEGAYARPVLITLFRKSNASVVVSLRSLNGEALKIAALLHGGGHPNACGAVLPRAVQRIPDALDYLKKVLNPQPPPPDAAPSLEDLFKETPSN
jgi:hypothetical protein